ncbi:Beta-lactamase superfamily protein [Theileria parva strain Muguga]|uniref:Beta-lactamase superfamily protein n=1 Tax=Theileria parva strain Muguga TaxID=333668 RepID=UPI001C61FEEC|nr:Beta-lactamase superfamily protein [Theileria parva strain Muguga]EAN31768.2 Beta-lactamase superfamily protein [Theileria parva strain Muguga]
MSYVQIIGWNEFVVPPSVQIFSEGSYFIFNCGENSQRFRISNRLGLGKIRYVFLTHLSVSSFNGLPSLILSLDGCNTEHVTVFGPKPLKSLLTHLLNTFKQLSIRVTINEVETDVNSVCELVKSNSLTVYGFSHSTTNSHTIAKSHTIGDSPENSTVYSNVISPVHENFIGYFIQFDTTPGTFNPNSPALYSVMKSDYGKLKSGLDVTLSDGTVVKSDEVCDAPTPGNHVLILSHPTPLPDFIHSINNGQRYLFYLQTHASATSNTVTTDTIGGEVYCSVRMEELGYIALPPYYKRNLLHYQLFPKLFHNPRLFSIPKLFSIPNLAGQGTGHVPLTKFIVHPPKQSRIDVTSVLPTDLEEWDVSPIEVEIESEFPKLTFLGTGCSVPSVYRNVSAILLQLHKHYSILLDCGEGTVLQMLLISNSFDDFIDKISSIRLVFISHSHADHHLGLYHLISLRNKFNSQGPKPLIIASHNIRYWLKEFENICHLDYDFMVLTEESVQFTVERTLRLSFFKVDHIEDSYGIRIDYEFWSLVYSGDTKPCDNLIKHCENVNFLIHEATFTDEYAENAMKTLHSTVSQAIEVAAQCNVETLFLTHFSQRFQTMERVEGLGVDVVVALDLMTIPLKSIQKLKIPLQQFNTQLYNILNPYTYFISK